MLSLATHEPHVRILREDVTDRLGDLDTCRLCGQDDHPTEYCTAKPDELGVISRMSAPDPKFVFLNVGLLRLHLEKDLEVVHPRFQFDLEQAIDDWVVLLFLVGNDFLPHLPCLKIHDGAIDTLVKMWKEALPELGGYVSEGGELHIERLLVILERLGKEEAELFVNQKKSEVLNRTVCSLLFLA